MSIGQIARRADWSVGHLKDARAILQRSAQFLADLDRKELAGTLEGHFAGLGRDIEAQVVVAGEFKSGKTALINALVGQSLLQPSPIETTVVPTVIRHGESERFCIVRTDGSEEEIEYSDFCRLAASAAAEVESLNLAHLTAEVPSSLLASGITLIDTPSLSGGLSSTSAGMVLGYIHASNALMLVSDASQEFTAAEAEFINLASGLGDPVVVSALTKTDLYEHWEVIQTVNQGRLEALGLSTAVIPVSPMLHAEGLLFDDGEAIEESGIDILRWYLTATLIPDVIQAQTGVALLGALGIMTEAKTTVEQELAVVGSTDRAAQLESELLEKEQLLDRLSTNLQSELQHEISRYQTEVSHALERALSDHLRPYVDDLIDRGDPLHGWPAIREQIVAEGNRVTAEHFNRLDEGLERAISTLMDRAKLEASHLGLNRRPDVERASGNASVSDLGDGNKYRVSNAEVFRAGTGGLMSAAGTVTILGPVLGAVGVSVMATVLAPLSGIVGVVGMTMALQGTLARRRETDVEESRRKAKEVGRRYVGALSQDLREQSKRHQIRVSEWTRDALASERESIKRRTAEEIARLRGSMEENEQEQKARTSGHVEALGQLDLDVASLKKLIHTLSRPEMQAVRQ